MSFFGESREKTGFLTGVAMVVENCIPLWKGACAFVKVFLRFLYGFFATFGRKENCSTEGASL